MANILVIDDNPINRETFAEILEGEGHGVISAGTGEEGLAKMGAAAIDAVLCDLKLPNLDGLATMELAHERFGNVPWILITGHGNEQIAVEAIKQGAFNYLTKPVDLARLKATVASASRLAAANRENKQLRRELGFDEALDRIVGTSAAVRQMKAVIQQVAATDASILIDGESGTGKELVADAIHALSNRSGRPYVKLNMAAIPKDLLESELFGHERGAFTGAVSQKKGKFEVADTGTIFLDEIGEMPLDSQVKLLRVLQDGSFTRIGGNAALTADVRLVCATNRNLKEEVLANRFRMDLYFRLNVVNILVPPLRDRREDIPLLAQAFVERLNRRHHQDKILADAAIEHLRRQDWPGNIRELENAVEKMHVLTSGRIIGGDGRTAPRSERQTASTTSASASVSTAPTSADEAIKALIGLPIDEIEHRLILATIERCDGNKTKASRMLGIGTKTLYRKLESYGAAAAGAGVEAAAPAAGASERT